MDRALRGFVENPYPDDEPAKVPRGVITWSLGEDGLQGNPKNGNTLEGSDDVAPWRYYVR